MPELTSFLFLFVCLYQEFCRNPIIKGLFVALTIMPIHRRVHIHCRIQFWHICFTPPSLSLYLSLSFSVSLLLSPNNSPIYHSLSYPPHRSNSLKRKERKEGKRVRDEEGMRERERENGEFVGERRRETEKERER